MAVPMITGEIAAHNVFGRLARYQVWGEGFISDYSVGVEGIGYRVYGDKGREFCILYPPVGGSVNRRILYFVFHIPYTIYRFLIYTAF
jgi:hypothetical protein